VATDQYIFVSNGNNDCVSVIDARSNTMLNNIYLKLEPRLGNLRGAIPFGLAISPDQQRLYVAAAGINAVAVVDVPQSRVLGYLPTAWFPAKLAVSNDGKQLMVANAKGYGSGPNGGVNFQPGPEGSNIGKLMKGTVSILDIPGDEQLANFTEKVRNNNYKFFKLESIKTHMWLGTVESRFVRHKME
jgi:YVTN family beta-propeller protein